MPPGGDSQQLQAHHFLSLDLKDAKCGFKPAVCARSHTHVTGVPRHAHTHTGNPGSPDKSWVVYWL